MGKTEWWGASAVICLQQGAFCTISAHGPADTTAAHCLLLQKIQTGFTFLVPAHLSSHGWAIKSVLLMLL